MEKDEPVEIFLHRNLLFASASIVDGLELERGFILNVLSRLAKVIQRQPYSLFKMHFIQTVRSLPGSFYIDEQKINDLEPLLVNSDWEIRMEATRLLSTIARESPLAKQFCEAQLKSDRYLDVRCHAALGLVRAGEYRKDVWSGLAHFRSESAKIEAAFSDFLKNEFSQEVFFSLIGLLSDESVYVRLEAAVLLQKIGSSSPYIVETAIGWLLGDDSDQHSSCVRLLQVIASSKPHLIETLIGLLTNEFSSVRREVANLLQEIGGSDQRIVEALIGLLSDQSFSVRPEAARLLKEIGSRRNFN